MRDETTGIHLDVEEAMAKLELYTLTGQHNEVGTGLSGDQKSLVEHIDRNVVRSGQTIAEVKEAVIDNPGLVAQTAALVNSEQRRCTEENARMEERC